MEIKSDALCAALTALSLALPAGGWALTQTPSARSARPGIQSPFILDPGHGGEDLGAVVGGKREKDIALAIARKVKRHLEALAGVSARLTRESDVFLPLDQRVGESLEWNGTAFISLHVNEVRTKELQGITVYAFGPDRSPGGGRRPRLAPLPPPPREQVRASAALAGSIARSLRAQGLRVGPPERASFYVLKNPGIPSVLIELGYLSNPQEAARLNDPAYQERLARALAASLQSHFAQPRLAAKAGGARR